MIKALPADSSAGVGLRGPPPTTRGEGEKSGGKGCAGRAGRHRPHTNTHKPQTHKTETDEHQSCHKMLWAALGHDAAKMLGAGAPVEDRGPNTARRNRQQKQHQNKKSQGRFGQQAVSMRAGACVAKALGR